MQYVPREMPEIYKKSILDDLNSRQREAVREIYGPILIVAGPGSGKTKTLTYRIAYLLSQGVSQEEILAVTFTNKAANEMKERISSLTGIRFEKNRTSAMWIGTFHSVGARILRENANILGYQKNFSIFDEDDSLSLLKEVMKEGKINPKQFPAGMLAHHISRLKNNCISPEEYERKEDSNDLMPKILIPLYRKYQAALFESNAVDFDDLITLPINLFKTNPEILEKYQMRFRFVMIDEHQDTNLAQHEFISLIAQKNKNICVVGDPDQSIYAWRGADSSNFMKFNQEWPGSKTVVLDQNYRSSKIIVSAASRLIQQNSQRKEKNLWTKNKTGDLIRLTVCSDEETESRFIVDTVKKIMGQYRLKDIAVLYRTNALSRSIEEEFLNEKIHYRIIGGIKFYQRKEIKDLVAYLRFIENPKDLISLKRIINTPARGIGKKMFFHYLINYRPNEKKQNFKPALEKFDDTIASLKKEIKTLNATEFLKLLIKKINYKDYLDDSSLRAEERWENVQEFINLCYKYDSLPPEDGINKMLEDIAIFSEEEEGDAKEGVSLMTLHSAKGLEFKIVFIAGFEEGVLPHARSLIEPSGLEEERRLCYVGMTRAKEKLFLSLALSRYNFGSTQMNPPSRFIGEIPEDMIEISEEEPTISID